jgi:hypothetical protein
VEDEGGEELVPCGSALSAPLPLPIEALLVTGDEDEEEDEELSRSPVKAVSFTTTIATRSVSIFSMLFHIDGQTVSSR